MGSDRNIQTSQDRREKKATNFPETVEKCKRGKLVEKREHETRVGWGDKENSQSILCLSENFDSSGL